jgi:YjbE family integral membrane protein
MFDWSVIKPVLQILLIDVVLSGDNAVVIALAAHRLPSKQRKQAVFWGAAGAIGLRVILTAIIARLLVVPLLRFGGGLFLTWIAVKLLLSEEEAEHHHVKEGGNLFEAVKTIIFADFIMSLDNMLAVGGASEGNVVLIVFGLLLSIAIIMTCSTVIANLMNRFPILTTIGGGILGWTAGEMLIKDPKIEALFSPGLHHSLERIIPAAVTLLVIALPRLWVRYMESNGTEEETIVMEPQVVPIPVPVEDPEEQIQQQHRNLPEQFS